MSGAQLFEAMYFDDRGRGGARCGRPDWAARARPLTLVFVLVPVMTPIGVMASHAGYVGTMTVIPAVNEAVAGSVCISSQLVVSAPIKVGERSQP